MDEPPANPFRSPIAKDEPLGRMPIWRTAVAGFAYIVGAATATYSACAVVVLAMLMAENRARIEWWMCALAAGSGLIAYGLIWSAARIGRRASDRTPGWSEWVVLALAAICLLAAIATAIFAG